MVKMVKAVILGYGDRSSKYADYSIINPSEMSVIAVIDIEKFKLELAQKRFNLPHDMLFTSLDDFLARNIKCDVVINGTMDQLHYSTSIKLLKKGYNILLEKPVTSNPKELLEIRDLSKKNNCKVIICHVLRYTPFYKKIKEIIDSKEIGDIVDIQMNEHVWYGHFINAFVRGKWNNEQNCGSGLLLAKCCHDTDLMCWLNNNTKPLEVSSFGKKAFFSENNAPKESTDFCYNCPCKSSCMFDAYKFELLMDAIPNYIWAGINKPIEEITLEEKKKYLQTSEYGKCVFKTTMDIVDRQCVSVNFENGSIGTLNLVGGTSKSGRFIHILCNYGEVFGYVEENKLTLRRFNKEAVSTKYQRDEDYYTDEVIDINVGVENAGNGVTGHYGGDYFIMQDLVNYLSGKSMSSSITVIEDSINGHFIVYGAEKSRKEHTVVNLRDMLNE